MNIIAAANKICWLLIPRAFSTIKFSHSTPNKTIFVTSWLDHEWPSNMVYETIVQILDFDLFKYSKAIKTISEEDINGLASCPILQKSEKIEKISWPCLAVKHGQGKTCWPCMTMKHGQIRLSLLLWILLQLQTRSVDCWYQELFPL